MNNININRQSFLALFIFKPLSMRLEEKQMNLNSYHLLISKLQSISQNIIRQQSGFSCKPILPNLTHYFEISSFIALIIMTA